MSKQKEQALCHSGSGQKTNGGTFAPGGDAKYKSALIARVIDGDPSAADAKAASWLLAKLGYSDEYITKHAAGVVTASRARAILKERNWTRFLDKRQATLKSKAEKSAAAKKASAAKKAAAKKAAAKKASAAKKPARRSAKDKAAPAVAEQAAEEAALEEAFA